MTGLSKIMIGSDASRRHLFGLVAKPLIRKLASGDRSLVRELPSPPLLLFIDYDGTLVPITGSPEEAVLPEYTYQLLYNLTKQQLVTVVIVSGRDQNFLERQCSGLPVHLAAEHGGMYLSPNSQSWETTIADSVTSWYIVARKIVDEYTSLAEGSSVELKKYSIAWHYHDVECELGEYHANKLREELGSTFACFPISVIDGKRVVEIRVEEANKGSFVNWFKKRLNAVELNIMAIGDDQTDEDMFGVIEDKDVTIHVGNEMNTTAKYRVNSHEDVIWLLENLLHIPRIPVTNST